MALTVYNAALANTRTAREGYTYRDSRPVASWRRKGRGLVTTLALADYDLRAWSWPIGFDAAARASWEAFFRTLAWLRDPFLLQDPYDAPRAIALEPAVGDAARVLFSLPTAETSADYPTYVLNDLVIAHGVVAAADKALASIDVDARTVTFAAAPGNGLAVSLVAQPLRLARLMAPVDVNVAARVFAMATLELEQIPRP